MLFRLTKSLRTELGVNDRDLAADEPASDGWFEWYGNLFFLQRRKCLLFSHARTLFSFVVPGVRRRDLVSFGAMFRHHLELNLRAEGFRATECTYLLREAGVSYGKTLDRAILGSMNDHVRTCKFYFTFRGGDDALDFKEINRELNAAPMGFIAMRSGTIALAEGLKSSGLR